MEDDQIQNQPQAENIAVDESTAPEASPTSDNQTTTEEATTQAESGTESGDSQPEVKEPSRRLKKRFEQIFEKGRQAGESLVQAEGQLAAAEARFPWENQETTLLTELEEKAQNGELSLADLDRLATLRAEQKVNEVLSKRQAEEQARSRQQTRLASFPTDVAKIEEKYSHYNPQSEDYDEELVNELSEMYLKQVQANPDAAPSFADFIDGIEKVRSRGEDRGANRSAEVLATQSAQTAFRPTGGAGRPSAGDRLAQLRAQARETGDWKPYFAEEARISGR